MKRNGLISASEVASWAFCPESWRLRYGLDLVPDDRPIQVVKELQAAGRPVPAKLLGEAIAARKFLDAQAVGNAQHEQKAVFDRRASRSLALGRVLIALAALLAALLAWWWR